MHEGQDVIYEFEILRCDTQLAPPKEEPVIPKKCFFIVGTGLAKNLAISVDEKDAYAPRTTGLYNVAIQNWEGTGSKDTKQMWWYDDIDHSLHSKALEHENGIMFEGYNKNLVVFKHLKRDNQKFGYNGVTKFWRNDFTKRAIAI